MQKHCHGPLKGAWISSIWIATEFPLLFSMVLCCYTSHFSPFIPLTNMRTCTETHTNTNSTTHFTSVSLFEWGEERTEKERREVECGACSLFIVLDCGWMTELEAPHSLQHNNHHQHIKIHTVTHTCTAHALIHLWQSDVFTLFLR